MELGILRFAEVNLTMPFEVFIEILLVVVYEKFLLLTDAFLWGDYI